MVRTKLLISRDNITEKESEETNRFYVFSQAIIAQRKHKSDLTYTTVYGLSRYFVKFNPEKKPTSPFQYNCISNIPHMLKHT